MALEAMAPAAIAFVFIAIVIAIGADVLTDIQGDQVADSEAYNASEAGLDSLTELGGWLPTIALVVAAAIVIGVLSYFRS